jgi:hypothetical protein
MARAIGRERPRACLGRHGGPREPSSPEDLDQAKAFAHEPHVFAEPSEPAEIGTMSIAPIGQTPVAFAFIARKAGIDLVEALIRHLGCFDHAARLAATIKHDPALAGCRGVRLVLRATRRGLHAFDHEFEQLIGERGTVAESECAEVLILFGDRLAPGFPRCSENDREMIYFGSPTEPTYGAEKPTAPDFKIRA